MGTDFGLGGGWDAAAAADLHRYDLQGRGQSRGGAAESPQETAPASAEGPTAPVLAGGVALPGLTEAKPPALSAESPPGQFVEALTDFTRHFDTESAELLKLAMRSETMTWHSEFNESGGLRAIVERLAEIESIEVKVGY